MAAPKKRITVREKEFADLIVDAGLGSIQAARKAFGWKCETGTSEYRRAINLRKSDRIKEYIEQRKLQITKETEAHKLFLSTDRIEWDQLRKFAFKRLKEIRDGDHPGRIRFNAIEAIEKLSDPSTDVSLILRWIDVLWRGARAHCPKCHNTFPMWKIKNKILEDWRTQNEADPVEEVKDMFDLRMEIIKRSDKRKKPHTSQIILLSAPERHVAGLGPARSGKSLALAWMALLSFLIPGVEIWILSRTYDDSRSEVEYLDRFLNTLFFPHLKHILKKNEDTKSGEMSLTSKWGSELRIMSAKAKGSITGRELEMALIAEPGWVPDDIFNHLRARMSSRLGRIIMLGTPQGYGGILGRMVRLTGRNPETGKIIRVTPDQRTIKAGCPWNISFLKYSMDPSENPEYVQSELQAARMELHDTEYASEFEGIMASTEGSMFPQIKPSHLLSVPKMVYNNAVFTLGVDQGPKNFAACLVAYDGSRAYVCWEYFSEEPRTMKSKMKELRFKVPQLIEMRFGGEPSMWKSTIFDVDPPIINELEEFAEEGKDWPGEILFRPKNKMGEFHQSNWRAETYEFINQLAASKDQKLFFDEETTDLLHDQLLRALALPPNPDKESTVGRSKGWIINDPWRGDHVVDAFVMAMWTIFSGQTVVPDRRPDPMNPYSEQKAAFEFMLARDEKRQLQGFNPQESRVNEEDLFEHHFGRKRDSSILLGVPGYYRDES